MRGRHLAFYRDADGPELTRLRTGLRDLRDITAQHDVRLLVAIFPESYQVGVADADLTPHRVVLGECAALGIRCLDLQPACAAVRGDLFSDTQHPNARGHEIAAAEIRQALVN